VHSADGRTVVGHDSGSIFLWTCEGGRQDLGFPTGTDRASAGGLSPDGSVVVGGAWLVSTGKRTPFRWTAGGGFELLDPAVVGVAGDASTGGAVITGWFENPPAVTQAFRWTQSEGFVALDFYDPPNALTSRGERISPNGRWIHGHQSGFFPNSASIFNMSMLWTDGAPTDLSGFEEDIWPGGMTADGSRVVYGTAEWGVIWINSLGSKLLYSWIEQDLGIELPGNAFNYDFQILDATGISDDGLIVTGFVDSSVDDHPLIFHDGVTRTAHFGSGLVIYAPEPSASASLAAGAALLALLARSTTKTPVRSRASRRCGKKRMLSKPWTISGKWTWVTGTPASRSRAA
jgi:hypothetical protein